MVHLSRVNGQVRIRSHMHAFFRSPIHPLPQVFGDECITWCVICIRECIENANKRIFELCDGKKLWAASDLIIKQRVLNNV